LGLRCPYCAEELPSHRDLRVHVGAAHREKTDDFMEEHFGGRWIEADFVTLMLQRAIRDLTDELCDECGKCMSACPLSKAVQGFSPRQLVSQVRSGEVKEILKSDVIWKCTSCISCKELCPDETPPFEIIKTLRSLSARIGYHFPQGYKEIDEKVSLSGIIQDPQPVLSRTGERLERNDLGLPTLDAPVNLKKFTEAVEKLSKMRVVI
jgi:heterodisulfide reductase subunit C